MVLCFQMTDLFKTFLLFKCDTNWSYIEQELEFLSHGTLVSERIKISLTGLEGFVTDFHTNTLLINLMSPCVSMPLLKT